MNEKLDLTSLVKAITRLQEGLARYEQDIGDTQIRDGLIQRFEFTYEISHKMLRRFLETTAANPSEIDTLSFQDLIRTASERGLLSSGWPTWKTYREMRAKTSHTYDEDVAVVVVAGIPAFLQEVVYLRESLERALG